LLIGQRRLLRLYYFVLYSALGVYVPFFPTWLRARGLSGFELSTVMALNPLMGIVSPIIFGLLADALGLRGSLLRITVFGALVSMAAIAIVSCVHAPSYFVLLGAVAIFAFFRSPCVSIADVTALEDPSSYGRTRLFGSAGFAAMVVVAGRYMHPEWSAELPAGMTCGFVIAAFVTSKLPAKGVRPPSPVVHGATNLFRDVDFALFLIAGFLWFAAHVAYDLCFSMHVVDVGGTNAFAGECWAVGVVTEVLLMSAAPALFARASVTRLLAVGLSGTAVRFILLSRVHTLWLLLALSPLHAISFALVWIASLEYVKERAPAHVLATAQSLFSAATSLGSVTGMLTWGALYARRGGDTLFFSAALVAALGAALAVTLDVRNKNAAPKSAPTPLSLNS
jgi:PPP family 3-phenylpropionic acid transporter